MALVMTRIFVGNKFCNRACPWASASKHPCTRRQNVPLETFGQKKKIPSPPLPFKCEDFQLIREVA
jgi:hypothetical protein